MSSDTADRTLDNPWFIAAFLCVALAAGLLWQSLQIEADADRSIDQLYQSANAALVEG